MIEISIKKNVEYNQYAQVQLCYHCQWPVDMKNT